MKGYAIRDNRTNVFAWNVIFKISNDFSEEPIEQVLTRDHHGVFCVRKTITANGVGEPAS